MEVAHKHARCVRFCPGKGCEDRFHSYVIVRTYLPSNSRSKELAGWVYTVLLVVQPSQGRKKCGDKNDSERLRRVSSVISTRTCSGMLRFPDFLFHFTEMINC